MGGSPESPAGLALMLAFRGAWGNIEFLRRNWVCWGKIGWNLVSAFLLVAIKEAVLSLTQAFTTPFGELGGSCLRDPGWGGGKGGL